MTAPLFPFLREIDTVILVNAVSEWLKFRHKEKKINEFLHVIGRTIISYSTNLIRIDFRNDTLNI